MIQCNSITKNYGKQTLFEDVSFSISAQERIGLIGRNGSGKSTLFRLLLGEEEIDGGQIVRPKYYTVGHLNQHLNFKEPTVLDEASLGLPVHEGGWRETYKAEAMLGGLGFSIQDLQKPPSVFSGGFQIRINLAKLLLSEPNLLLLDEPTNYLDVVSIRWLREFLQSWPSELILITHDRGFLDSVSTHTLAIHRERVRKVRGSSVDMTELLAQEEELYEKARKNEERKRQDLERYINRFRAQATRAASVQSRVKTLAKMETKDKLSAIKNLDFEFNTLPFPGKWLMEVRNLSFRYSDDQPWLINDLSFAVGKRDRIAIVGPNGRGKTTLLKLLAGELNAVDGEITWNSNTSLSHFGQTNIQRLNLDITVEQELIRTHPDHSRAIARSIAGLMMFEGDDALKSISVLSGGERSRVLLGKILITPTNLLLLDEPTNHLDLESIDCLLEAIDAFEGGVIIVTHSEMILRSIATRLIVFDRDQANIFEGSYDDFLERIGWSSTEEAEIEFKPTTHEVEPQQKSKNLNTNHKDFDSHKSEKQKKSANKKISKVEGKIIDKETKIKEVTLLLEEASLNRDLEQIRKLGTELAYLKQEVEDLFAELEGLSDK